MPQEDEVSDCQRSNVRGIGWVGNRVPAHLFQFSLASLATCGLIALRRKQKQRSAIFLEKRRLVSEPIDVNVTDDCVSLREQLVSQHSQRIPEAVKEAILGVNGHYSPRRAGRSSSRGFHTHVA